MLKKLRKSICSILLSLLLLSDFSVEVMAASQQSGSCNEMIQGESNVIQLDCEVFGYNQLPEIVPYATTFVDASITNKTL